jgi:hypothetical protein
MTREAHLDGNALGALFRDLFGREMTHQRACCDACGVVNLLGAAMVYRDAPGDVVRCANCGTVLMVAVASPTGTRLSIQSLRWVEISEQ